jgi:hypothetical protein
MMACQFALLSRAVDAPVKSRLPQLREAGMPGLNSSDVISDAFEIEAVQTWSSHLAELPGYAPGGMAHRLVSPA